MGIYRIDGSLNAARVWVPHGAGHTTDVKDTRGKGVTAKPFKLIDIPGVMLDKLGWEVAAKLMDEWFRTGPWTVKKEFKNLEDHSTLNDVPSAQINDGELVKMAWANKFVQVKDAKENLYGRNRITLHETATNDVCYINQFLKNKFSVHKNGLNTATKNMILKRLIKAGWVPPYGIKLTDYIEGEKALGDYPTIEEKPGDHKTKSATFSLGKGLDLGSAFAINELLQVNTEKIGGTGRILGEDAQLYDDWSASMGAAQIKMAITGEARVDIDKEARKLFFVVHQIGFYIQDWYDFGVAEWFVWDWPPITFVPESLGYWNSRGIYIPSIDIPAMENLDSNPMIQSRDGIRANSNYDHDDGETTMSLVVTTDFNNWRRLNKAGGDLLIFSDVEWYDIDKDAPYVIEFERKRMWV